MLQCGKRADPLVWINLHELQDKALCVCGDVFPDGIVKFNNTELDFLENVSVSARDEGDLTTQYFVQNNTSRPHIRQRTILDTTADIDGDVWRQTDHSGEHITIDKVIVNKIGVTKVTKRERHGESCAGAEDILRAHIAVDDILAMNMVQCGEQFAHDDAGIRLWETWMLSQEVAQRAPAHVLEDDKVLFDG